MPVLPLKPACKSYLWGGNRLKTEYHKEFDGDILGSLTLADTPAVNLNKAVNFLNNYPYGCLEQTISGAWPFLILPDAVAELDPLVTSDSGLKERTDGAIARIQSMQLYDGS